MATVDVLRRMIAVDYDGSNGQAIADIFGWTVVSDNGTTLVLTDGLTGNKTITLGQYVVYLPENPGVASAEFQSIVDTLGSIWVRLSDLATSLAFGSAAVSGSLLGQNNRVFNVTLNRAMPGTSYETLVSMATGAGMLGLAGHTVTNVSIVSDTVVQVTLNSGAGSQAGTLQVIALA